MSKAIVFIALFVFAGIVSANRFESHNALWQSWKIRHNKNYAVGEEAARFAIFVENVNKITKHNQENSEVKFAINKFADLTASEFKAIYASGSRAQPNADQKNAVKFNNANDLPDTVDWREKGAVTPVKDQGQCGSCWTFSATGAVEGFYFTQNGKLLSFSEQQIVDCDTDEDEGCNGGWHYLAIEYAGKNGLELETDYPYTARDGKCKYDSSKAVKTNKGYAYVTANNTNELKTALANIGPVSVAIEADQSVFQFYSRGVISAGCGADLDHAVLTVGYTKVGVLEAFIVKNSWGKSWGDQGYVMISTIQQLNRGQGACGILAIPVIVN